MQNCQISTLLFIVAVSCFPSNEMIDVDENKIRADEGLPHNYEHLDYCNHHKSVTSHEGTIFAGYSLKQVHIVLSPGHSDASFKVKVENQSFPPLPCDLKLFTTLKDFKTVTDMFKDINHNPHFHEFHPTFPKVCANDHLTSLGFEQLISLGQLFNASYFSHGVHKKLKAKYSSLHVESIPTEKSYQSVLGFLYGLLERKQLLKTKIYRVNRNFCEFIESNISSCSCPKTQELAPHVSQALTKGTFLFKPSYPNRENISNMFHSKIKSKTSGLELFNALMQYKCDSYLLEPCAADRQCKLFSNDKLAQLHSILANDHHFMKMDSVFRTYSELRVYPFLQQVLIRAKKSDHQSTNIYMGHSHFIQLLTTSLGVFRKQITPLASRLVIEIYRKNGGQLDAGGLYLRFLYNGADVTTEVSGCSLHMIDNFCKIEGLTDLVAALRKQYLEQC
ncbi:2-phosphoxylose phosphatase 1-like isoform X2 [Ruditapes philippinarum]|uniref:2-phosphoxylose phosphatase 1-like isoform X2 n=1 Tax=Ruditapes philippinarum TaxID=129788 RepID=UPI00295A8E64|nr:2-phosphoxylose phosphatase 1-like isoform X2 [Ruditapes philippinarum]